MNRCLVLTVDEDRDQTRAIHDAQRKAQTLAGLAARAERERVVYLHRDAQRLLEPLAVVNPFADRLTFADARTRTRRDHGKHLGLIAAVTLLHQHQRPRRTATVGGQQLTYVESTLADIEVANRLAHAVLGQSLDELPPQTRRLLSAIHVWVTGEAERLDIPVELVRFTRRQLRETLLGGVTPSSRSTSPGCVDLELLVPHRLESGGFAYELAWRGEGTGSTGPAVPRRPVRPRARSTTNYNGDRSGVSPTGRGPVGPRSGVCRGPVGTSRNGSQANVPASPHPDRRRPLDSTEPARMNGHVVVAAAVAGGTAGGR